MVSKWQGFGKKAEEKKKKRMPTYIRLTGRALGRAGRTDIRRHMGSGGRLLMVIILDVDTGSNLDRPGCYQL